MAGLPIIFLIFLLVILAYPVVGFIQILNSIQRYNEPGGHPLFYDNIESYWVLVLSYFILGAILFSPFITPYISRSIYNIYFFGISFPIMLYNLAIMKKDYRDKKDSLNLY